MNAGKMNPINEPQRLNDARMITSTLIHYDKKKNLYEMALIFCIIKILMKIIFLIVYYKKKQKFALYCAII